MAARSRWRRGQAIGFALLIPSVWFVADSALHGHRLRGPLAAAIYVLVVLLLTHVQKHYRIEGRLDPGPLVRTRAIWVQLFAGVVLMAMWGGDSGRTGRGFLGLTLIFLSIAWGVAEIRESQWPGRLRGHALLIISLVVSIAAVLWNLDSPTGNLAALGLAVMAGQLGVVTASQEIIRRGQTLSLKAERQLLAAGGALLAIGTGFFAVGLGLPRGLTAVVLVFVFMLLTTSRGEWDSVMILLVFAIFWGFSPSLEQPPGHLRPDGTQPFFVAFGDSYISGEGAATYDSGTNTAGVNECRRAPTAYPARLALDTDNTLPDQMISFACSGARARELWDRNQSAQGDGLEWTGQIGDFTARIDSLNLDIDDIEFALVSIGGNDANFAEIAGACVGPGDCSEIAQQWLDDLAAPRRFDLGDDDLAPADDAPDRDTTLEDELVTAYEAVIDAVDGAPVVVVPYPQPVNPDGCDESFLTDNEHRFLAGFVDQLNAVVESATRRAGVHLLATMPESIIGNRICDGNADMVHFIELAPVTGALQDRLNPAKAIHNSFHPKPTGHERMAAVAAAWLAGNVGPNPAPAPSAVEPASLAEILDVPSAELTQCSETRDGGACAHRDEPGTWVVAETVLLARSIQLAVVLVLLGSWLISLVVIFHFEGGRGRDFELQMKPGPAERALHAVFAMTGVDRLVGSLDDEHHHSDS